MAQSGSAPSSDPAVSSKDSLYGFFDIDTHTRHLRYIHFDGTSVTLLPSEVLAVAYEAQLQLLAVSVPHTSGDRGDGADSCSIQVYHFVAAAPWTCDAIVEQISTTQTTSLHFLNGIYIVAAAEGEKTRVFKRSNGILINYFEDAGLSPFGHLDKLGLLHPESHQVIYWNLEKKEVWDSLDLQSFPGYVVMDAVSAGNFGFALHSNGNVVVYYLTRGAVRILNILPELFSVGSVAAPSGSDVARCTNGHTLVATHISVRKGFLAFVGGDVVHKIEMRSGDRSTESRRRALLPANHRVVNISACGTRCLCRVGTGSEETTCVVPLVYEEEEKAVRGEQEPSSAAAAAAAVSVSQDADTAPSDTATESKPEVASQEEQNITLPKVDSKAMQFSEKVANGLPAVRSSLMVGSITGECPVETVRSCSHESSIPKSTPQKRHPQRISTNLFVGVSIMALNVIVVCAAIVRYSSKK